MKVISSAELRNNMKKYLDLAKAETVVIRRGKTETFVLQSEQLLMPDEDLARAITKDELLVGVKEDLRQSSRKVKMKVSVLPEVRQYLFKLSQLQSCVPGSVYQ